MITIEIPSPVEAEAQYLAGYKMNLLNQLKGEIKRSGRACLVSEFIADHSAAVQEAKTPERREMIAAWQRREDGKMAVIREIEGAFKAAGWQTRLKVNGKGLKDVWLWIEAR